ncbi:Hypothetical predicted protein [Paramuricea clavata]|uniref:Uncharacterized protein n=1 Tax=Paramuricea clavata TaxID=317549 RepID=A0A6S7ILH4_PARCT|nr:Hypothetical predicted protein [Paramuricea clavata]
MVQKETLNLFQFARLYSIFLLRLENPTWFAFNQSYFQFVATPIPQGEAKKVCLEKKGDLASTSSKEEQAFLFRTFVETNSASGDFVWVGLNDIAEEGTFVWTDGSPNTYAKFADGQPDNYVNNEHCINILKLENGDYGDAPCDATFTFICETNYESL